MKRLQIDRLLYAVVVPGVALSHGWTVIVDSALPAVPWPAGLRAQFDRKVPGSAGESVTATWEWAGNHWRFETAWCGDRPLSLSAISIVLESQVVTNG